jgi:hypothetical protein
LHAAGAFAEAHFGVEALYDLTSVARGLDNRSIAPTGVPTWTFAGNACNPFPNASPSYLFPNDGIVGMTSAYGAGANLGPATKLVAPAYHQGDLQKLFAGACGAAPIELTDATIIGMIRTAAASLQTSSPTQIVGAPAGGLVADAAALATTAAAAKPTVMYLQTASVRSIKPRGRVSVGTGASLVSRAHFTVRCAGRTLPALPALGGRAFGFPAGLLGCAQATITSSRHVTLGIASDAAHVVARITQRSKRLTVTVSANRRLSKLTLAHGRRKLKVAQHRHGSKSIAVSLTRAQASSLMLTATVQRHAYRATIPPLT